MGKHVSNKRRPLLIVIASLMLAACSLPTLPSKGDATPEEAARRMALGVTPDTTAERTYSLIAQQTLEDGRVVVLSQYHTDPTQGNEVANFWLSVATTQRQLRGWVLTEYADMATSMDPTLSINKLSNARVLGGPQTVGAIYGEPVASEVTAVEATFLDGWQYAMTLTTVTSLSSLLITRR